MIAALILIVAAVVGAAVLRNDPTNWPSATFVTFVIWYVGCRFLFAYDRVAAERAEAAAIARVRAATGAERVFVDPPRSAFVAVDAARTVIIHGAIDGGATHSIALADLTAARLDVRYGLAMWFNREWTPPGRLLGLAMLPLAPLMIIASIASLFDGSPGHHGTGGIGGVLDSRIKRITLVLTRTTGEEVGLVFYDERRSAIHPRAKAREYIAREVLATARRPILAREKAAAG